MEEKFCSVADLPARGDRKKQLLAETEALLVETMAGSAGQESPLRDFWYNFLKHQFSNRRPICSPENRILVELSEERNQLVFKPTRVGCGQITPEKLEEIETRTVPTQTRDSEGLRNGLFLVDPEVLRLLPADSAYSLDHGGFDFKRDADLELVADPSLNDYLKSPVNR